MNLEQSISKVQRSIVHAPDKQSWRDDVRGMLQDKHTEILSTPRWKFLRARKPYRLLPDLTIPFAQWDMFGGTDNFTLRLLNLLANQDTLPTTVRPEELDGHTLFGSWFAETDANFEHVIERTAISGIVNYDLTLDPRYAELNGGVKDPATMTALEVRFRRYQLPTDCAMVLGFKNMDDDVPIEAADLETERFDPRPLTSTGTPTLWYMDPGTPRVWNSRATKEFETDRNEPPQRTMTATVSVGGSLLASTSYSYAQTWFYAGRHSPMGPIVTATTTAVNQTITLGNLDTLDDNDYGRTRYIWRREGENGPFYLVTKLTAATATTFADTGAVLHPGESPLTPFPNDGRSRFDHITRGGQYQYFRPWPRPEAVVNIELRYFRHPRPMIADEDEPDMPQQFHMLPVHLVVEELAGRYGQPKVAKMHKVLAADLLRRMRARELIEDSSYAQRKLGSALNRGRLTPRLGPVTITE